MSRPSGTRADRAIPTRCARRCWRREAGADGITAHLREDRRHITDDDIARLSAELPIPLNLEMAATDEMLDDRAAPSPARRVHRPRKARGAHHRGRARRRRPAQSSRADGPRTRRGEHPRLAVHRARPAPDRGGAAASARRSSSSTPGAIASWTGEEQAAELRRIADAAALAVKNGIEPHAGHGLTFDNVVPIAAIPQIAELNIGHFLIGEAIFDGLAPVVRRMRALMDEAR